MGIFGLARLPPARVFASLNRVATLLFHFCIAY